MAALFDVKVLTPKKVLFEGKAVSLVVPAALGYLGILAHHAPLIAALLPGRIILKGEGEAGAARVIETTCRGFLEVADNAATILLEADGNQKP